MQPPPFRCSSDRPSEPLVICEARIHGTPNLQWWKHPDSMMKDFRALLDNVQDRTHPVATYRATREVTKHMSCNKTYISDERLHPIKLGIYHGINVQVEGLDGGRISLMFRCTGSQSWHGGDRRTDCMWVKQPLGWCYGLLNRRLPWQLQWHFKILLQNEDWAFVEYWSALVLTTIPENPGNLDPVWNFV